MKRIVVLACLLPAQGLAEPLFEPLPDAFGQPHIYDGGWEHFVGGGAAIFDCNGDAKPDLFLAGGALPSTLFLNTTDGHKIQFSALENVAPTGVTGAYPIDIDSDGNLDLVILRAGANGLYRGLGDCSFEDATNLWNFHPGEAWSTAFSATWEAGQDFPTLAIGNYVDRGDPEGPFGACHDNELHRPGYDGYGDPEVLSPGYCALSMLISDWQRSGSAELRISNDRHYYAKGGHEEMWRLDPLGPRTEEDGWAQVSLWGMGVASADITGDGRPEVMLTSMGDQLLQFNEGTGFKNAPYETGTFAQRPHVGDDLNPSTGWHAEFADVDNDGLLDLFIAKGNVDEMGEAAMADPNNLLIQTSDGKFVERSVEAGVASTERGRGGGLADFDGDGRLDLLVVNRRAPAEVWRNVSDAGNWVAIELQQDGPNRRAVSGFVEVETDTIRQVREITIGGGHAGGQAGPIHFGLGTADSVRARAIWPDGSSSNWIQVTQGQIATIQR